MKKRFSLLSTFLKVNPKYRYYVFGTILVCIFLLTYFVFTRPQLDQLQKLTPEIKTLSDNLEKTQTNLRQINNYAKQVQTFKEEIQKIKGGVLTREDVPLILEKISQLATKNGIKIDQLIPYSDQEKVLFSYDQLSYFVLPISMEGRSGYHNFGRFLDALEEENLSFKIRELSMASTDDPLNHAVKLTLQPILVEETPAAPVETPDEKNKGPNKKTLDKKAPKTNKKI